MGIMRQQMITVLTCIFRRKSAVGTSPSDKPITTATAFKTLVLFHGSVSPLLLSIISSNSAITADAWAVAPAAFA